MHQWVETHGFEVLLMAGLFSLIMSAAPAPPAKWGFWKLWAFGAAKAAGANAGNFLKHQDPALQEFTQKAVIVNDDGTKTTTATETNTTPQPDWKGKP